MRRLPGGSSGNSRNGRYWKVGHAGGEVVVSAGCGGVVVVVVAVSGFSDNFSLITGLSIGGGRVFKPGCCDKGLHHSECVIDRAGK